MDERTTAACDVLDLRVSLSGTEVLRGITLSVAPREIVALVGESGSGKSVLGATMMGLLPEAANPLVTGCAKVAGTDMVVAGAAEQRRVRARALGVVFQDPMSSLNPTMKVHRQIAEAAGDKDAVNGLLEAVGLQAIVSRPDAYPHQLSGGQRQRAMIAMAIARDPALVIADEPTTALDVTVQDQILKLILNLREKQGCSFLFITHDLGVAAEIADRIIVMRHGEIVETGSARAVFTAPQHDYTKSLLGSRLTLQTDRTRPLPSEAGAAAQWPLQSSTRPSGSISAEGVTLHYRGRPNAALDAVSLQVDAGRSVAVVGESGSGKSTLLRIMAGSLAPTSGTVTREGVTQVVFQDAAASLTPWMSVGTLLRERLRNARVPKAQWDNKVKRALDVVGLDQSVAAKKPRALSGGQAQRAALARAVVVPPSVLLADEPTSALDVSLAATVLNLLGNLRREYNLGMLFVTHDLAAARFIADDIVILRNGAVVERGTTVDVLRSPSDPYTAALLAAIPGASPGREEESVGR